MTGQTKIETPPVPVTSASEGKCSDRNTGGDSLGPAGSFSGPYRQPSRQSPGKANALGVEAHSLIQSAPSLGVGIVAPVSDVFPALFRSVPAGFRADPNSKTADSRVRRLLECEAA